MLKRIIAILLCLLLVFSFAACKKNNADGGSSNPSSSDATQDFEKEYDEWENDEPTDEE